MRRSKAKSTPPAAAGGAFSWSSVSFSATGSLIDGTGLALRIHVQKHPRTFILNSRVPSEHRSV